MEKALSQEILIRFSRTNFDQAAQSGIPDLKMASLSDSFTISLARQAALKIVEADPELAKYPLLKTKIEELEEVFVKD